MLCAMSQCLGRVKFPPLVLLQVVGIVRKAAGKRWVDTTMTEWNETDFRIFVGDLGAEVSCSQPFSRIFTCCVRDAHKGWQNISNLLSYLDAQVDDRMLQEAFQKYESLVKAKVVRNSHTRKSKGYGFVSFNDHIEGARALREMNGKYIGNRPCKLSKSNWQVRGGTSGLLCNVMLTALLPRFFVTWAVQTFEICTSWMLRRNGAKRTSTAI